MQGLVWELVEGALLRVSMRPSEVEGVLWHALSLWNLAYAVLTPPNSSPHNTQNPKTYEDKPKSHLFVFFLCSYVQGLVWELVEGALLRVSMRPTEDQVVREVAEWQAGKEAALVSMSRQLADR